MNWRLAESVACRVARHEPLASSYHYESVARDFAELTPIAEHLVEIETGLTSAKGRATAQVVDRDVWIRANLMSFQQLLGPLLQRLDPPIVIPFDLARHAIRNAAALEIGGLLGWMSGRVLGQYDALGASGEADDLLIVGPNVLALEKRFAFPPREFRLWLALHELTHRMQFTGVPWMRQHYVELVHQLLDDVDADTVRVLKLMRDIVRPGVARRAVEEAGIMGLFASPKQREAMSKIGGLMALLEGHGDVVMNRAGTNLIPSAGRFHAVLGARRATGSPMTKFLRTIVGLEAKLNQYEQGEAFIAAIEAEHGPRSIDRAWESPDNLPTLDEIRMPELWSARLGLAPVR